MSGAVYAPTNPQVTDTSTQLVTTLYRVLTNAAGRAIGDIIERVQFFDGSTLTSTVWYSTTGATLATAPIIGTDVVQVDEASRLILTAIEALVTAIGQNTDGLEAALATTNTAIDGVETTLTAINGSVDGLETLLGTTNTSLASVLADTNLLVPDVDSMRLSTAAVESALEDTVADGAVTDTSPIGLTVPRLIRATLQRLIGILSATGDSADVTVPANNTATSTVKGLLRAALNKLDQVVTNTTVTTNPRPNLTENVEVAGTVSTVVNTSAATANGTAKLRSYYYANGGTLHYLQIHVGSAAPVAGQVPVRSYKMFANTAGGIDTTLLNNLPALSVASGNSVYLVRSSSAGTYTPVTLTAANAVQSEITIERSW
jgi:hypothetical protein